MLWLGWGREHAQLTTYGAGFNLAKCYKPYLPHNISITAHHMPLLRTPGQSTDYDVEVLLSPNDNNKNFVKILPECYLALSPLPWLNTFSTFYTILEILWMEDSSPHLQPAPAANLKEFETLKCNEQNHFNYNSLHLKEQLNLSIFITVISTDSM